MARTTSEQRNALKRGWTTGACATAATKAAFTALLSGMFPDPVEITLPKGKKPAFPLASEGKGDGWASAGIIKDAGDDPDVTHGALVIATVRASAKGTGITFKAGTGVGTITLPGLPLPPGEPAINPVPRQMMTQVIEELAAAHGAAADIEIEISIPDGETLAEKTWNPRLGIKGGLSILGTTGIVHPFSCSAWIHSIHRGIDVARAEGTPHIAGATGSTSEDVVRKLFDLPETSLIDMGDFAGGMLKYLRAHPVSKITIAGGFGKLTKLAQGFLDLHSGRSQVDFQWLADQIEQLGGSQEQINATLSANTANQVLTDIAPGLGLGHAIAENARQTGLGVLRGAPVELSIIVIDRKGNIVGRSG
ncbi:MAG: cobalt-precorrin-5B (C(1))-methyltransferase [Hyphomicrobiales bacterium]